MYNIEKPVIFFLALFPPETLAKYIVTAVFTIINLLVTYLILKKFLFKPTIKFIRKRQDSIEADLKNAKDTREAADAKFAEASARIESSIHEASGIVNDAKVQAEAQSDLLLAAAKKEAAEIITRADDDIERMRTGMMEQMRDEVADLAVSIASKVIRQTIDESKQKELVDQFIGEEMKGKV
ncbi:MAG: F0F1 ATP synthase subunit B [Saccharofermentanales bacterium]